MFFIHREVTVADLRAAFKNIDPSLDATTLDWVLTMAFQIHQEELEQHTTQMDTELALQHLLVADVTRAGPAPQQDWCIFRKGQLSGILLYFFFSALIAK